MAFDLRKFLYKIPLNILKEGVKELLKTKKESSKDHSSSENSPQKKIESKTHPWRLCPIGEHWVRSHPLTIPESQNKPENKTIRDGHCRKNTSKKEFYSSDELREIARINFSQLQNHPEFLPTPFNLGFPNGNKYDLIIAGWTKFWNEILKPNELLSPDLVKALIASESSFNITEDSPSKVGKARGLIQVTEQTRKILQNKKGELKDHLIFMSTEESREPEINIAAGVRWLYHKKILASVRLNKEATWEEAIAEYKGILPQLNKVIKSNTIMEKINANFKILKEKK